MDKIRLRFISNRTFISWIVRVFTRSEWSHVDYLFDNGSQYSSLPSTGVDYNYNKNDREIVCEFPVYSKHLVERFLLEQRGKPYDWKAIIAMPFNRNWHDKSAWFCSELIAAAIEYSNHKSMFNEGYHRITPRDLFIHPDMKVIE